jgi:hypothetical protein
MNAIKLEPDSECNSSQYEDEGELPEPFTFVAVKEEIVSCTSKAYVLVFMLCIMF